MTSLQHKIDFPDLRKFSKLKTQNQLYWQFCKHASCLVDSDFKILEVEGVKSAVLYFLSPLSILQGKLPLSADALIISPPAHPLSMVIHKA